MKWKKLYFFSYRCRIFYEEYATLTSEKRSKLLDHQLSRQHSLSSCESLSFNADVSTFVTKTCTNEKNVSNKGRRDLPKWMFSKRKKIHLSDTDEEYNTEQKKSENKRYLFLLNCHLCAFNI